VEPLPYDDFLADLFHRARTVDAIIAESAKKPFGRVLRAAKQAQRSSIIIDSYVDRLQSAKRCAKGDSAWVPATSVYAWHDKDLDLFNVIVNSEPGCIAIDDSGNLYLTAELALVAMTQERDHLQRKHNELKVIAAALAAMLLLLVVRCSLASAA
jgi:hypothetical protein